MVHKATFGAFNSSNIDEVLREHGLQTIVMVGISTNCCVETTARDAADRGYAVVIVDEACADYDEAAHDASLRCFHFNFGRVVRSPDECSRRSTRPPWSSRPRHQAGRTSRPPRRRRGSSAGPRSSARSASAGWRAAARPPRCRPQRQPDRAEPDGRLAVDAERAATSSSPSVTRPPGPGFERGCHGPQRHAGAPDERLEQMSPEHASSPVPPSTGQPSSDDRAPRLDAARDALGVERSRGTHVITAASGSCL